MVDLHAIFGGINESSASSNHNGFLARSISDYPHFRIAKDSRGLPAVLISVQETSGKNPLPPIILEHLQVYFDVMCRITESEGGVYENKFTVVRCTGHEKVLHNYFLHVTRVLLDLLPKQPAKVEVAKAIATFIELFQAANSSPRKSIQGLWAELLLIDAASRPEVLVAAWHTTPQDRFDFSDANERLEVKSFSQGVRRHHFSLDQVTPLDGTKVLVASVFTEVANNGTTVMQLADKIRAKISPSLDLIIQLNRIVLATLGSNWQTALELAFDRHLALSSLRYYDVHSIPSTGFPAPTGVSEIRFKSDLSNCPPVDLPKLPSRGKLFSSLPKTQLP